MKTAYNIQGNLTNLLSSMAAGTVSAENAQLRTNFLYLWLDQTGYTWAFTDAGYTIATTVPLQGNPLVSFDGTSLQWMRPQIQTQSGSQDSKATFVCFPNVDASNVNTTAQTFFAGAQDGLFDGSFMYLFRYCRSAPQSTVGLLVEFAGWVGQIKSGRDQIEIEVNSLLHQANMRIPKRMYSPSCTHALYDAGCGLNKNNFVASFTIGAVDGTYPQQVLHMTTYPVALVGSWNLGTVVFTNGLNVGLQRTIKGDNGTFILSSTLPNTPVIGDTFLAYFGCDKLLSTCIAKFGNFYNFNGFPFIPMQTVFF
jgi:uncharacterized phage protein (TIGR02218 family)